MSDVEQGRLEMGTRAADLLPHHTTDPKRPFFVGLRANFDDFRQDLDGPRRPRARRQSATPARNLLGRKPLCSRLLPFGPRGTLIACFLSQV